MGQELTIRLSDPGMTTLHRAGLAGLWMSLRHFQSEGARFEGLEWELAQRSVTLRWSTETPEWVEPLLKASFGTTNEGLLDFAAHRNCGMADIKRVMLSEAVRMTFLQHNKAHLIPKGTEKRSLAFDHDTKSLHATYKPFVRPYAHSSAAKRLLVDKKGRFCNAIRIKGWLYPGGAERHSKLTGTELEESYKGVLCLLYAPMSVLYLRVSHRGSDGKYDERLRNAIVVPQVTDLSAYAHAYTRFLTAPVELLAADGLGDAGLLALLTLRAHDRLDSLGVSGCEVITMGKVVWSRQQQSRSHVLTIEDIDDLRLDRFDHAWRCLPNRVYAPQKPDEEVPRWHIATSLCRGHFAENVASGRPWFQGFRELMTSQERAKAVGREKGGLTQMVEEANWDLEADRRFVTAMHGAIRSRYGALASQARARDENVRFDREFERMRTGLMRVKNAATLRAEVADLFARGGLNRELQDHWEELLPLFSGRDWQRARDLALLALASYKGKGSEEIQPAEEAEEEIEA